LQGHQCEAVKNQTLQRKT